MFCSYKPLTFPLIYINSSVPRNWYNHLYHHVWGNTMLSEYWKLIPIAFASKPTCHNIRCVFTKSQIPKALGSPTTANYLTYICALYLVILDVDQRILLYMMLSYDMSKYCDIVISYYSSLASKCINQLRLDDIVTWRPNRPVTCIPSAMSYDPTEIHFVVKTTQHT